MSNYDRVSVVVGLILLGLALFLVIELPTRTFSFYFFGSPLTVHLSTLWLRAVLLAGLACTGTDYVIRAHPAVQEYTFVFWILPTMWVLLVVFLLPLAPHWLYWLGGLTVTGIFLSLLLMAEYHAVDPEAAHYSSIRWGLDIAACLIALALFVLVYRSKTRSLFSATATFAIGGLLALDILNGAGQSLRRRGLYAFIVGLVVGEATWALNYCNLSGAIGGLLLFLLFYLLAGLSKQRLQARLSRRIFLEFALVALLAVGLLLRYGIRG